VTSQPPDDVEQPLSEHLIELRNRLKVVVLVILSLSIIAFPFSGDVALWMWKHVLPPETPVTAFSPLEWMLTRLTLSVLIGLFLGIPVLVYEVLMFSSRGLYPHEKKFIVKIIPLSTALFLTGALIAYSLVLPLFFNAVILQTEDIAQAQLSIKGTFDVVAMLIAGFGIAFQFPLLIIFAIKTGIFTRETLERRRILVYGLLLSVALLVSPDPTGIAQLLLAFMLALLFEVSLLMSRVI
jgi:sec-independent protein translocase protein TatC